MFLKEKEEKREMIEMISLLLILVVLSLIFLYQLRGNKIERLECENKQLRDKNNELIKGNRKVSSKLNKNIRNKG